MSATLIVEAAGAQRREDHVAAAGLGDETDQRDLAVVAQELEREGRGRGQGGGVERGGVGDPALVDDGSGGFERAEPAGLVRCGAREGDLQTVDRDAGPVLPGRIQPSGEALPGGRLDPVGRGLGELHGAGAEAREHDGGEKDGSQAHGCRTPPEPQAV